MDASQFRGEVIFTFDGDAAGQQAALRAFSHGGEVRHPDLRRRPARRPRPVRPAAAHGDAAVRDLIAQRVPLFEFAIRSALVDHDLDTAEGRLAALDAAAPIVGKIKDRGLRQLYAVSLDRWIGLMDERFVMDRVRAARRPARPAPARGRAAARRAVHAGQRRPERVDRVATGGPVNRSRASRGRAGRNGHRQADQAQLARYDRRSGPADRASGAQARRAAPGPVRPGVRRAAAPPVFTAPAHAAAVRDLIAACGGAASGAGRPRVGRAAPQRRAGTTAARVRDPARRGADAGAPGRRRARRPVRGRGAGPDRGAGRQPARSRRSSRGCSALNPVTEQAEYNRMFGDLIALEQRHRVLIEPAADALLVTARMRWPAAALAFR